MPVAEYCTPQGLVDEFGEREIVSLTDIGSPATGEVDFSVAQRICDRVNAEIGANLAARYTLPLTVVPELLRYLAQDLAHFYLYQSEPPSWVQTRFDAARKTMRDVQTGALPLGIDATGAPVVQVPSDLPAFYGGAKVFGRRDWS